MGFLPERLKDIRLVYGDTVEDLAKKCNISKQAVSKYETGQAIPSTDILKKIVTFYSLPAGYLTKENILPTDKSDIFYRKTKKTPAKKIECAQINLKWFYEMMIAAKEICPMPSTNIPLVRDNSFMEEKAQAVREAWGLGMRPIDDLAAVLEAQGFYLFETIMKDVKVDGYSQLIGEYALIILNQDRGSLARKNFSLAHEIGHLLLHVNEIFDGSQQKEAEADEFAACFLMPEATFRKDVIRMDVTSMRMLGEKWHVSPQAVVERCFRLNMLGKDLEESRAHRQALLQRLGKKDDYTPQRAQICSLEKVLRKIDSDWRMRQEFLETLCLPVQEVQRLCQMPSLFEMSTMQVENVDDMDGAQMSFILD